MVHLCRYPVAKQKGSNSVPLSGRLARRHFWPNSFATS